MKKRIPIEQLEIGDYVHLPVKWDKHPFLLNSFKIKNEEQLKIIKHLGFESMVINPLKSNVREETDEQEQRAETQLERISDAASNDSDNSEKVAALWQKKKEGTQKLAAIEDRLELSKKVFEDTIEDVRSIFDPQELANNPSFSKSLSIVSGIYQKLDKDGNNTVHLMNDSQGHERLHYHSLNVSLLSMLICQAKGLNAKQTQLVSFAGLYHDIGKIQLPNSLLSKAEPLEEYDRNLLHSHVAKSLKLASKIPNFPPAAAKLISQHHELNDGSGYPEGLNKDHIHQLSKILIVANTYDNLCNGVNTKYNPHRALSYLYNDCRHLYDVKDVMALISVVGIYPPGTLVELSDHQMGVVISTNDNERLSPYVLVYDPSVPRDQAAIINIADFELSISKVLEPEELTIHQNKYLNPSAQSSYFIDMDG